MSSHAISTMSPSHHVPVSSLPPPPLFVAAAIPDFHERSDYNFMVALRIQPKKTVQQLPEIVPRLHSLLHDHLNHRLSKVFVRIVRILDHRQASVDFPVGVNDRFGVVVFGCERERGGCARIPRQGAAVGRGWIVASVGGGDRVEIGEGCGFGLGLDDIGGRGRIAAAAAGWTENGFE